VLMAIWPGFNKSVQNSGKYKMEECRLGFTVFTKDLQVREI
jgi:hypothetical protein